MKLFYHIAAERQKATSTHWGILPQNAPIAIGHQVGGLFAHQLGAWFPPPTPIGQQLAEQLEPDSIT